MEALQALSTSRSRIALVHDFLVDLRGADRVFLAICDIWPEADVYSTIYDEDGTERLFEDFNLKIKPGEKVALVGHSGGGKTTVTRLLLRFMDVESGEILVGGQPIDRVAQAVPLTLEVVDISTDAELEARYGLEIPVLLVNGKKAAKYRVTEDALRRLLADTADETG